MNNLGSRILLFCFLWPFLLLTPAGGQTTADTPAQLNVGAVMEFITKDSEAEKAGLQPGDLILRWSRASDKGSIESPFDMLLMEIDQAPRGRVTLEGRRGAEERQWTLGSDDWGIKSRPNLAGALLALYGEGARLAKSGEVDEATECWRKAAVQSRNTQISGSDWLETWFLLRTANSLADGKHWQQADEAYKDAVQQGKGSGPLVVALLLNRWAISFRTRHDWDEEEKRLQQAVASSEQAHSENLVAYLLVDLAITAIHRDDFGTASEQYLERALEIQERLIPDSLRLSNSLNTLGIIANNHGELAKAEECLRRAFAIREKLAPGTLHLASTLINLGGVVEARGNLIQAEEYFRRTLAITERLAPDSLMMATDLHNLGVIATDRRDFAKAKEYTLQALSITQRLAPESIENVSDLVNLCEIAYDTGDLRTAEQYCQQAHTIMEKHFANGPSMAANLDNLGAIALDRGDPDKAEQYYRQALAISDKAAPGSHLSAATHSGLGDVAVRRADLSRAEASYRAALTIQEKIAPGSVAQAEYLAALAGVLYKQQKLDAASQTYAQALNALESQMVRFGGADEVRATFRAQHAKAYSSYIGLLMSSGQPELAFQTMERSRARTLLEMLVTAHTDIHKGANQELLQQERNLEELLHAKSERRIQLLSGSHIEDQSTSLEKEIAHLQDQYQDVESQLRLSSPAYAALTQPQPLSLAEIQHLLDDNTLLLEYSLGEPQSYLWAVTPQSVHAYPLPKDSDVETAARHIYDLLTMRKRGVKGESEAQREARLAQADAEYPQAAAALSHMVLGPAASELHEKRLLIVGDGALEYVPFAALPEPGPGRGQPLIAKHEIVTLPSASVLAVLRREQDARKPTPHQVAVLADPVFDAQDSRVLNHRASRPAKNPTRAAGQEPESGSEDRLLSRSLSDVTGGIGLSRLLFSRQEAEAILAVAPKAEQLRALDFRASRATALDPDLGRYRMIHFATHGLVDSENPELSGLVLSLVDQQGRPQEGFLSLQDVYNLDLHADLVVLSACQTALGKQIRGEGLMGLTRGFMYAGATRVVASLWSVSDVATARLMERFYTEMERHELPPAAALRQAQIWMLKQPRWASPYYWAAFQMQGEWK